MRRFYILFLMILLASGCLFASGANELWFTSEAGAAGINGNYIDLLSPSSGTGVSFGEVGNTNSYSVNVVINQTDVIVGGIPSSDNFYFVNDNNNTITHPFTITYTSTRYSVSKFLGIMDYVSSTTELSPQLVKNSPAYVDSFQLPYTNSNGVRKVDISALKLQYSAPSTLNALEPGTYHCNLNIKLLLSSNQETLAEYNIILQAKYLADGEIQEEDDEMLSGFTFNITPTAASYNFDIIGNKGVEVKVADVDFYYSKVTSREQDYGNNPFTIAISANSLSYEAVGSNTEFRFVKTDKPQNQELSEGNSIKYTVVFYNDATGNSKRNPTELKYSANQEKDNTALLGIGSARKYLNAFNFNGSVSIIVDSTADTSKLTSGRYSTTLYYYVISNY